MSELYVVIMSEAVFGCEFYVASIANIIQKNSGGILLLLITVGDLVVGVVFHRF